MIQGDDMSGCSIDQKVKYTAGSFVGKDLTWWNSQILMLSQEVVVSMSWNDFKFMIIEEFCPSHEIQKLQTKLWNHVIVGASHAAYTNRFHELARLVPHLITPESRKIKKYVYGLALQIRKMVAATKLKTMQKAIQISSALTDEAVRNGSIKNYEKRGNIGEPSKDNNSKNDNKRTVNGNVFSTIVNPVGRENAGACPKCTTCNSHHAPEDLVVHASTVTARVIWQRIILMLSQEVVVSMSWNDFKFMIIEEFCPSHEIQKLQTKLWNHVIVGASHAAYTNRFHELARLVPHLITPESRKIKKYVYGLALQIRKMVAATKLKTMQKAIQISSALTDEAVRNGSIKNYEKRGN
nr:reverse transcriptase domain-containing protein [Tanacetum cinerariifolium]